jgi:radical SAM superfamily enzyme YgiQ (UPF0313 family)
VEDAVNVAVVYPEVLDMARYRDLRKEFPPFGALYIAAALEGAGHFVRVFKISPENVALDFSGFDAVAFSISASATFNLFVECKAVSTFSRDTLLMAGGIHANLLPEQTLLDLKPDVVGIGEGEDTVVEILEHAADRNFAAVSGVCYLQDGAVVRTSPRTLSKDIGRFLLPARHLLPEDDFVMSDRMSNTSFRMTHIMPGRGCPFPCRYCASAQTSVQYRSGANVRVELEHLVERYAIEGFAVVGNDFILNKRNVIDICESIEDLHLRWATLSRVDRVDTATLEIMRKGGCYEIEFGVESGSPRILQAMDKRVTVEQIEFAMRATYEADIKNKVFLVHGYPGEDATSTEETMRLLDRVGQWITRVSLFRFVPLPGTYVYNNARALGIRGTPHYSSWDGDWGKFHIHHNHHHWWGSAADFEVLTDAYWKLREYVEERWPSRFHRDELPGDRWQEQSMRIARPSDWVRQQTRNFSLPVLPAAEGCA